MQSALLIRWDQNVFSKIFYNGNGDWNPVKSTTWTRITKSTNASMTLLSNSSPSGHVNSANSSRVTTLKSGLLSTCKECPMIGWIIASGAIRTNVLMAFCWDCQNKTRESHIITMWFIDSLQKMSDYFKEKVDFLLTQTQNSQHTVVIDMMTRSVYCHLVLYVAINQQISVIMNAYKW